MRLEKTRDLMKRETEQSVFGMSHNSTYLPNYYGRKMKEQEAIKAHHFRVIN